MRGAALLLLTALPLAACGGEDAGTALQNQEAARAADLAKLTGWDRVFHPDAMLAAANQFGLRSFGYSPSPNGYRAVGGPVMIASSASGLGSQVSFEATGASADKVDVIAFDLGMQDPKNAKEARKRFADLIRDFLFQSKVDAAPIHDMIAQGKTGEGTLDGTPYAIAETKPDANGVSHMTVTFTRGGASAPAASQTQGK